MCSKMPNEPKIYRVLIVDMLLLFDTDPRRDNDDNDTGGGDVVNFDVI